jgi:hypothetical protein
MPKSTSTREHADLQHLTRVRALTAEVAVAISAIEHNDLARLQSAVANQERICSQLVSTKWTPSIAAKRVAGLQATMAETGEQIQAAYVALAQINRVYAGVVKRSGRSVELLLALYSSLGGGYGPEPTQSETLQTLSCEV